MNKISGLMRSTRAATAVEYGLILALIFIAIVTAVKGVATQTGDVWTYVSTTSADAMQDK